MNFNELITKHVKGPVQLIEDVYVNPSFDGTSAHVTLCGPYGKELSSAHIADAELDALQTELSDCNFLQD